MFLVIVHMHMLWQDYNGESVPEIKLTLSGLEASSFTSWVISLVLNLILEIRIFCFI